MYVYTIFYWTKGKPQILSIYKYISVVLHRCSSIYANSRVSLSGLCKHMASWCFSTVVSVTKRTLFCSLITSICGLQSLESYLVVLEHVVDLYAIHAIVNCLFSLEYVK